MALNVETFNVVKLKFHGLCFSNKPARSLYSLRIKLNLFLLNLSLKTLN